MMKALESDLVLIPPKVKQLIDHEIHKFLQHLHRRMDTYTYIYTYDIRHFLM